MTVFIIGIHKKNKIIISRNIFAVQQLNLQNACCNDERGTLHYESIGVQCRGPSKGWYWNIPRMLFVMQSK